MEGVHTTVRCEKKRREKWAVWREFSRKEPPAAVESTGKISASKGYSGRKDDKLWRSA